MLKCTRRCFESVSRLIGEFSMAIFKFWAISKVNKNILVEKWYFLKTLEFCERLNNHEVTVFNLKIGIKGSLGQFGPPNYICKIEYSYQPMMWKLCGGVVGVASSFEVVISFFDPFAIGWSLFEKSLPMTTQSSYVDHLRFFISFHGVIVGPLGFVWKIHFWAGP